MNPQAATLLAAFLIQASPILEEGALKLLQWLVDQIPTHGEAFFDRAKANVAAVWLEFDDPGLSEAWRRELASEIVSSIAREMGVELDAEMLRRLALA